MFKTELIFYFSLFFDFKNTWWSVALKRFRRESLENRKTFKQIRLIVVIMLGPYFKPNKFNIPLGDSFLFLQSSYTLSFILVL